MKTLMILGAGTYQKPLIDYACLHYEVVLVAPSIDEYYRQRVKNCYFYDIRDEEKILEAAKRERVDGIITDQTDIPMRTVAYVANQLGLPGNPYEVACLYTDKALMRKRQIEDGIKILPNVTVNNLTAATEWFHNLGSDVIIKPIDNQGSRGVALVTTEDELAAKFEGAMKFSLSGFVMLEKRANGRQFAVEGVALNGKFRSLIVSDDNYFSLGDCFAARSRVFNSIAEPSIVQKVLSLNDRVNMLFGLEQGLSHAEYIMDGDDVYLLEVGMRGGGAYISSDIIPRVGGLDTAEFLCKIACGDLHEMPALNPTGETVGYVAFYLPGGVVKRMVGIQDVQNLAYVHRNTLSSIYVGKKIDVAEDKTSRQLLVVSGRNRDEWNARVDQIRSMLSICVETPEGREAFAIW